MNSCRAATGFVLVSALFLLVVLALLGTYMLSQFGVQQSTVNNSLLATRAYNGARTGLDWAIHRALYNTAAVCGLDPVAVTTSFPLSGLGMDGMLATVGCRYTQHNENTGAGEVTPFNVYVITSTASHGNPGDMEYAERRLQATVSSRYTP